MKRKNLFLMTALAAILLFAGCDAFGTVNSVAEPELVKYGELVLSGGGTIPIYKTASVTNAQMTGVVGKVQEGYDDTFSNKGNITTAKVSAIHIIGYFEYGTSNGAIPTCVSDGRGKFIISLPYNMTSSQVRSILNAMGGTDLGNA